MSFAYDLAPRLTAAPSKPRAVIASKARAAAIVERVAEKHAIGTATLLCARWDRFVMIARAEVAAALRDELNWPQRMIGEHIGCSQPNVRKLFSFHEKYARRVSAIVPVADPEGRVRDLERELQRLSGIYTAERLAQHFDLQLRCAIVLAILAEAYPRYVRGEAMLRLYDEACDELGYGARNGANANLITKNLTAMSEALAKLGMTPAYERGPFAESRRLTDVAAEWLYERTGPSPLPRRSAIEAVREAKMRGEELCL